MNDKLITYEEAKRRLKIKEPMQRTRKKMVKLEPDSKFHKVQVQKHAEQINMLLSIIHAHKQARKYYGKMKKLHDVIEKDRGYTNPFYRTKEIDE